MNIIFTILGSAMAFWYWCFRWTLFADKVKYAWAYTDINLFTAFTSIVFITPTLFKLDRFLSTNWQIELFCMAIFLLGRNIYYTYEDIRDFTTDPKFQTLAITIDIIMGVYCFMYLLKSIRSVLLWQAS